MKAAIVLLCIYSIGHSQSKSVNFSQRANSPAVFGGMGVQLISMGDVVEYLNALTTSSQQIGTVGTMVDFFGGVELPVAEGWGVKFEHSYSFKSYSVAGKFGGTVELFNSIQLPTVMVQRIITGYGYFVKFGIGGGYHFGSTEQKVSTFGVTTQYSGNGIGIKTEVVGQTAFDDHVYGYIGGSLGWEILGVLKDNNGNALTLPGSSTTVSMQYFSAGLRFGVTYFI